ncbi:MAG: hypothetical protein E7039_00140 [Lentisphaerae bacterium]|nr:hypothetical protein [Lentisphaerota bacterium]
MRFFCLAGVVAVLAAAFCGCAVTGGNYFNDQVAGDIADTRIDLKKIYAAPGDRTPVILIHGLLGAELRDKNSNGERVWGDFSCFAPEAEKRFMAMALSPERNSAENELFAADILRKTRIELLGIKFELENYSRIIELLRAIGYIPEKTFLPPGNHYSTLFIYHYDWRKSIDENAAGLARFVDEKKEYLENQFKSCPKHRNKEVRFDLLGHSMGGLIARYYVEYGTQKIGGAQASLPVRNWYGAKNVRKLVMAGSPNAGYTDVLFELVNGMRLHRLAPEFPAGVLATFPSCYQMMPEVSKNTVRFASGGSAVDIFDIKVWQKYRWGLLADTSFNRSLLRVLFPNVAENERLTAATEYVNNLLNKASRFKLLFSRPVGVLPEPVKYYLFASAGLRTNSLLEVDDSDGSITIKASAPGDGKVTLQSAGFNHRQKDNPLICSDIYVLDGGHMGFMESTLFACNLALVLYSEL